MRDSFFIAIAIILFSASGCEIINPEEPIPAYLKIDTLNFDASSHFSSNSHKIKDIWVYINGDHAGTYEMPFTVPIIADGVTQVRLIPGVNKDGIKSLHMFHPYLSNLDTSMVINPGETLELTPTYTYLNNFTSILNEDFESPIVIFESAETTVPTLAQTSSILLDGNESGVLYSTEANQEMKIISTKEVEYNVRTFAPVLEISYQSSIEFNVGVEVDNIENYESVLRPTNGVTGKVYIDFSDEMNVFSSDAKYKVYMEGVSTEVGDYIAIDNVRLLLVK